MPVFIALEGIAQEGATIPFGKGTLPAGEIRHLTDDCPLFLAALTDEKKAPFGQVRNTKKVAAGTVRCERCWSTFEEKEKERTGRNPGSVTGAPAKEDRKAYAVAQRASARRRAAKAAAK